VTRSTDEQGGGHHKIRTGTSAASDALAKYSARACHPTGHGKTHDICTHTCIYISGTEIYRRYGHSDTQKQFHPLVAPVATVCPDQHSNAQTPASGFPTNGQINKEIHPARSSVLRLLFAKINSPTCITIRGKHSKSSPPPEPAQW
jgi:hypothetical protein